MNNIQAQSDYCLEDLKYTRLNPDYSIDSICYKGKYTIVHFRFVGQNGGAAMLTKPGEKDSWILEGSDNKNYPCIKVANVRRDGVLVIKNVKKNAKVECLKDSANQSKTTTVLTWEIHFKRLPETENRIDLLEGTSEEARYHHLYFSILAIKLKTQT